MELHKHYYHKNCSRRKLHQTNMQHNSAQKVNTFEICTQGTELTQFSLNLRLTLTQLLGELVWFVLTKNGFVTGQQRQTVWDQTWVLVYWSKKGIWGKSKERRWRRYMDSQFSIEIIVLEWVIMQPQDNLGELEIPWEESPQLLSSQSENWKDIFRELLM